MGWRQSKITHSLMTEPAFKKGATFQSTFDNLDIKTRPQPIHVGPSLSTLQGMGSPNLKPFDTWVDTVSPSKPFQNTTKPRNSKKYAPNEDSMPLIQQTLSDRKTRLAAQKKGMFEEIKDFKLKGEATVTIAEGSECQDNMMSPGLKIKQRHIYQKEFDSPTPAKQKTVSRRPHFKSEALVFPSLTDIKDQTKQPTKHSPKHKLMRLGSFSDDGAGPTICQDDELTLGADGHRGNQASKSILHPEPNSAALSNRRKPVKVVRVIDL